MTEHTKRKIEVELTDEEYKDLEEFVKEHPKEAKDVPAALRMMAGIATYREMKKKADPKRLKSPAGGDSFYLPQELGIPFFYPCALGDYLRKAQMTYPQFINAAVFAGFEKMQRIIKKNPKAGKTIAGIFADD